MKSSSHPIIKSLMEPWQHPLVSPRVMVTLTLEIALAPMSSSHLNLAEVIQLCAKFPSLC